MQRNVNISNKCRVRRLITGVYLEKFEKVFLLPTCLLLSVIYFLFLYLSLLFLVLCFIFSSLFNHDYFPFLSLLLPFFLCPYLLSVFISHYAAQQLPQSRFGSHSFHSPYCTYSHPFISYVHPGRSQLLLITMSNEVAHRHRGYMCRILQTKIRRWPVESRESHLPEV